MECAAPEIQEALLERAGGEGQPLAPEHLWHLEACESCRTSLERVRRLARTWRTLEPTSREIGAARARFALRLPRRRGRAVRLASGGAVLAVLLAGAVASAAAQRVLGWIHFGHTDQAVTAAASGHSASAHGPKAPMTRAPLTSVPSSVDATSTPSADVMTERAAASAAVSIRSLQGGGSSRSSQPRPASTSAEKRAPVSSAKGWTAAASAMRAGYYAQAAQAFDALVETLDEPTRDAARLSRAQVWLAQGRISEARLELESLSNAGSSESIRRRAAEALEAIP